MTNIRIKVQAQDAILEAIQSLAARHATEGKTETAGAIDDILDALSRRWGVQLPRGKGSTGGAT